MLSSKDIVNVKFDKVMGRGYKADEVDRFLAEAAQTVDHLLEEKQEAEQKLMVLAEKLEEYKQDEDSLRSALIGAQKLGDSVIRDARARAQQLLDDANMQAGMLVDNAKKTIEREQSAFIRMQREVATFKGRLQHLYKQHLELISTIPADEKLLTAVPVLRQDTVAPEAEETLREEPEPIYVQESYATADTVYGEEQSEEESGLEYSEEELPEEDMAYDDAGDGFPQPHVRDSHFGPLKFGKEYDIKRDGKRRK